MPLDKIMPLGGSEPTPKLLGRQGVASLQSPNMPFLKFGLRPATPDDLELTYDIKHAAFRVYAEEAWGPWEHAVVMHIHRELYDPAMIQLITLDGQDVGWIGIEPKDGCLLLANIHVLPAYQGRGIGGWVITAVLDEAREQGLPVRLRVLKCNPRARVLYVRLGFRVVVAEETETHYTMACGGSA